MPHEHNIIAYHGTTETRAKLILARQHFISSCKNNEWLGTGVYFFPYQEHAARWIQAKRFKGQGTCILCANLVYTEEQLLDLDDPAQLQHLNEVVKAAVQQMNANGTPLSVDLSTCNIYQKYNFFCNLFKSLYPNIGIISYTFRRGGTGFSEYPENQRQICVSCHSIIKDIRKI